MIPALREYKEEESFAGTARFKVIGPLGAGGMGAVYRALDVERGRFVALKTIRGDANPQALVRFKREFRALADVHHQSLVALGELGEEHGTLYYTMELVEGVDVLRWVREGTFVSSAGDTIRAPVDARPSHDEAVTILAAPAMPSSALPTETDSPATLPVAPPVATVPASASLSSGPRLDERRLRHALAQLVSALRAVHAAGLVHRDVKPQNTVVSFDGRLVLLDFGLVRDIERELGAPGVTADHAVLGTVEYMAPEQAAGDAIGPAADAYAVGVILYEALTGRRPFAGNQAAVLWAKQHDEPAPPSSLRAQVPADLEALALALLQRDPARRPDDDAILAQLGVPPGELEHAAAAEPAAAFVGRAEELGALADAARAMTHLRVPQVVLVDGESGVGKTTLVRHFLSRTFDARDDLVLFGRCYERESVPFKGVDGVVDRLATWLGAVDPVTAASVVPRRVHELARAFPVLLRSGAVARAPREPAVTDPQERRSRVFAAARELFARLAESRRVVVAIDDLQWADDDSLALLAEILRPPDAPALLLLATVRGADGAIARLQRLLAGRDLARVRLRRMHVERLSRLDAEALAMALLEGEGAGGVVVKRVVQESGGHPLFLRELARYQRSRAAEGSGADVFTLDDIIRRRAAALSLGAQQLARLVVLAPAPIDEESAAVALGASRADIAARVEELGNAQLVRASATSGRPLLEPWHTRVRDALRAFVPREEVVSTLLALAAGLSARGGEDEALFEVLREAGDQAGARVHAARAAARAMTALAFDHAANLYRESLHGVTDATERRALLVGLGDAHGSLGRGRDAAESYLEGAGTDRGPEAVELRRRAAEQLLRAGHFEDGKRVLAEALAPFGLTLPGSSTSTILSLVAAEAKNKLRGLAFTARAPADIAPEVLRRIDVTWTAAMGLAGKDNLGSAYFQARHLALALAAGDRYRISRALSLQAGFSALGGDAGRANALAQLARARELAIESGHPHAAALNRWMSGFAEFMGGRFEDALALCESAEQMVRDTCPDATWERSNCHVYILSALAAMGELHDVARRLPAYASEAEARGDLYETANLPLGSMALVWAARDDVAGARGAVDEALRRWGAQTVTSEDVLGAAAGALLDLYEGNGPEAMARVDAIWKRAGLFRRVAHNRATLLELRARGAILRAARDARMLAKADDDARALAKVPLPWAQPASTLLRAAIAHANGKRAEAEVLLRDGASALDRCALRLHAVMARRALGALVGGDEGRRLIADADAWLHLRGILHPSRFARIFVPGFG